MQTRQGFHFLIERDGAPAYVDVDQTINFRRAEGNFVAPDRAYAAVRVITPGLIAEIQTISIAEKYWETNLVSGKWVELPAGMGFNPAILFDPAIGLPSILAADLHDAVYTGLEELKETPGKKL